MEARLANIPPCLIGMEACVGAHLQRLQFLSDRHHHRVMAAVAQLPWHQRHAFPLRGGDKLGVLHSVSDALLEEVITNITKRLREAR